MAGPVVDDDYMDLRVVTVFEKCGQAVAEGSGVKMRDYDGNWIGHSRLCSA